MSNLTGRNIKNSYQELVTVGANNTITNGTGSLISNLAVTSSWASNAVSAVTASYALNAAAAVSTGSLMVTGSANNNILTFTKGDGTQFNLTVATGSAISASYAAFATTAGTATTAVTASNITTTLDTSATLNFLGVSAIGVNAPRIGGPTMKGNAITASFFKGDLAGTASFASDSQLLDGLDSTAFAILANNNNFAGNQTFNNITVNGTGSFAYLQQVTGSVTTIGDAFIILNTGDASRYAGIIVEDSGSAPVNYTASFFFDSVTNDWNYEYTSGSTDYGVALFGPTYSTKGTPTYPTANKLQKGNGNHHLTDSIISDNGSSVTVSGSLIVDVAVTASAGFSGNLQGNATTATTATTASYALTASYVEGGGGSIVADSNYTASLVTAANAARGINASDVRGGNTILIGSETSGNTQTVAVGDLAKAYATSSIAIGKGSAAGYGSAAFEGIAAIAIGTGAQAKYQGTLAIGFGSDTGDNDFAMAIGYSSDASGNAAMAIGKQATAAGFLATSIGNSAQADAGGGVSLGQGANAGGTSGTTALGGSAIANADFAIAVGNSANATNTSAISIGHQALVDQAQGIAIGKQAAVQATNGIAIGSGSQALGANALAFGHGVINSTANHAIFGYQTATFNGGVTATSFTGSFSGTATNATSASYAIVSDTAVNATSASYSATASLASAVTNLNISSGSLTFWQGSQAEYNAISSSASNTTIYFVI